MGYIGASPISPTRGGTGVQNARPSTITLGGALTTVGAFTSSFTMTGNTAVTFPTSGTLATTSQLVSNWVNVTGTSVVIVKDTAYQANNAGLVTLTMPSVASSTFGDTIRVGGFGAGGWLIQCVATQIIHFGSVATTAAGSIASTNRYDQIELVCSSTTNEWFCRYVIGNLSVN